MNLEPFENVSVWVPVIAAIGIFAMTVLWVISQAHKEQGPRWINRYEAKMRSTYLRPALELAAQGGGQRHVPSIWSNATAEQASEELRGAGIHDAVAAEGYALALESDRWVPAGQLLLNVTPLRTNALP
ncbi:hypothetical protein [Nocardioides sp. GXZ039]|uniref:hypothetical protein n=1 Tax=Nocardioides sp. GXZ039 TaxID=3136018 RepID=UPI0030F4A7FE